MTIDLICCHPKDILYPQWMDRINKDRELFRHFVVVMTQKADNRDYTEYLGKNLKDVRLIREYLDNGRDWRNAALQKGITYLNSEYILFMEEDFLVEDGFFKSLFEYIPQYDVIGFENGDRFHPACLLVNKNIFDKTSRDFSVDEDIGDHFVKLSRELKKYNWMTLDKLRLPKWEHLAGLTQNYRLHKNFYQPAKFFDYLKKSIKYEQPEDWVAFTVFKMKEVKNEID